MASATVFLYPYQESITSPAALERLTLKVGLMTVSKRLSILPGIYHPFVPDTALPRKIALMAGLALDDRSINIFDWFAGKAHKSQADDKKQEQLSLFM